MGWIGCVDVLVETLISGWAADSSDLARQVSVEIFVNSAPVAAIPAAAFREDLRLAGIGDGCKGFQFDPSPCLKPGRNDVEVRYGGSGVLVEKGRGRLIRPYGDSSAYPRGPLLAALQAYYEFRPEHHICEIAPGCGAFLKTILEAGLPFRKYTGVDPSAERLADLRARFREPRVEFSQTASLNEKADLLVSPAAAGDLKELVERSAARPAWLAVGFHETDSDAEIRRAFRQCGLACAGLDSIPGPGGERELFAFGETAAEAAPAPVLVHVHVPKCAGTSFRGLLERYWGPGHMGLYVNDTYFVYSEEALRSWLLRNPGARACSSHHIRTFPRRLAGREMLYVAFLRDPVEQFVSYMTHIRKHYAKITSRSLLEAVPPDAPRLSLREFARWLLSNERDIPFRENHNVNFFTRHSSPGAADRLAAAKAALGGFFFVGIAERMEESVRKLRTLAEAAGLDFPPGAAGIENTSAEFRDDLSWIDPADEVGSMLLHSVELDRQLYDWAMARLDEDFWANHSPRNRLELSAGLA
jgi:hypothetical protein